MCPYTGWAGAFLGLFRRGGGGGVGGYCIVTYLMFSLLTGFNFFVQKNPCIFSNSGCCTTALFEIVNTGIVPPGVSAKPYG